MHGAKVKKENILMFQITLWFCYWCSCVLSEIQKSSYRFFCSSVDSNTFLVMKNHTYKQSDASKVIYVSSYCCKIFLK